MVLDVALTTETMEIPATPDNVKKEFKVGESTFQIVDLQPAQVTYRMSMQTQDSSRIGRRPYLVDCQTADGQPMIRRVSYRIVGDGLVMMKCAEPLPVGTKLVLTYPAKSAKVKLPFKFENAPPPKAD